MNIWNILELFLLLLFLPNFRGRSKRTLKTFYIEQLRQIMQHNTANSIFHIMSLQLRPVFSSSYFAVFRSNHAGRELYFFLALLPLKQVVGALCSRYHRNWHAFKQSEAAVSPAYTQTAVQHHGQQPNTQAHCTWWAGIGHVWKSLSRKRFS